MVNSNWSLRDSLIMLQRCREKRKSVRKRVGWMNGNRTEGEAGKVDVLVRE